MSRWTGDSRPEEKGENFFKRAVYLSQKVADGGGRKDTEGEGK